MVIAWAINPVVLDKGARRPKVALLEDPGSPKREVFDEDGVSLGVFRNTYSHSSCIGTEDWCLSFIRGIDLRNLNFDPEITVLIENGESLARTIISLGWSAERQNIFKTSLISKGVNSEFIKNSTPVYELLTALGRRINPEFTTFGTWVR